MDDRGRVRYEILVATLLSEASLATFRPGARPTAIARRRTHRLRIPAAQDLSDVVSQLIEHDVQVLEIRSCIEGRAPWTAPPAPPPGPPPGPPGAPSGPVPMSASRSRPGRTPGIFAVPGSCDPDDAAPIVPDEAPERRSPELRVLPPAAREAPGHEDGPRRTGS